MTVPHDVDPSVIGRLTCGALRLDDVGQEVTVRGWVTGGVISVGSSSSICATVRVQRGCFNPEIASDAHEAANDVRNEYVLEVRGFVRERPHGTRNPKLATGDIEVEAHALAVLNTAKTPPFEITQTAEIDEAVRLRHRYLDLRRSRLQANMVLRHAVTREMREYLSDRGFVEVETPLLIKSTPEGARDFLVPSSSFPGDSTPFPNRRSK